MSVQSTDLGNVHEGTNIQSVLTDTTRETSQTQEEMQKIFMPLSAEKFCLAPMDENHHEIAPSKEQFIELIVPDHEHRAAMESILTKSQNGSKVG